MNDLVYGSVIKVDSVRWTEKCPCMVEVSQPYFGLSSDTLGFVAFLECYYGTLMAWGWWLM